MKKSHTKSTKYSTFQTFQFKLCTKVQDNMIMKISCFKIGINICAMSLLHTKTGLKIFNIVIPREGLAGTINLLVWYRQRSQGLFYCDTAHYGCTIQDVTRERTMCSGYTGDHNTSGVTMQGMFKCLTARTWRASFLTNDLYASTDWHAAQIVTCQIKYGFIYILAATGKELFTGRNAK